MSFSPSRLARTAALALILCALTAEGAAAQSSSFEKSVPAPSDRFVPKAHNAQEKQSPVQAVQPAQPKANTAAALTGWSTEVEQQFDDRPAAEPEPAAEATTEPPPPPGSSQANAIERVNAYFNSITHLQGTFVQVDANDERTRGRFYVQRPGRIRFDYIAPSALRIVSDGDNLSIEDLDLKTVDTYPLEKTPFRMLLSRKVDLVRDARVVGIKEENGALEVTLADRVRESGDITLIFDSNGSSLTLKEWVIDDAQGLRTRIMVGNLVEGKALSAEFFEPTPMTFPTLPN